MPSRLAVITFLDEAGSPGYPSQGLPGYGHPDQSLPPGHQRPDHSLPGGPTQLPVYPFDPTAPDNSLPGGGSGGHPSTGPIVPGRKFIVKWLACVGLILVPDNELPGTPEPK